MFEPETQQNGRPGVGGGLLGPAAAAGMHMQ